MRSASRLRCRRSPSPAALLALSPSGCCRFGRGGWETEVALPVTGTFTTPAQGSLRADAVLTAPEDLVPVLFVEVDNHTEPAPGARAA